MAESVKASVPKLSEGKSWERYKKELEAWRAITNIEKKKQATYIVMYGLLEGSSIKDRVMEDMTIAEWSSDTGFETLVTFLSKHLEKDDLTDGYEKYVDFEMYERDENEPIKDYVAKFDQKYNRIARLGMKISSQMLALKLLMKANLSECDRMLVMTGMDYSKKEELYDQTKISLKKFKGEMVHGSNPVSSCSSAISAIKLEPAFLAQHEEALYSAGYVKKGGRWGNGANTKRKGRYGGNNSYQKAERGGRGGHAGGEPGGGGFKRKVNPKGADGDLLRCHSCGSFRHMMPECPDSWENMKGVNVAEDIGSSEHVVLFTDGDTDALVLLSMEAQNCAVLDSACTSTVCGEDWICAYTDSLSQEDQDKIKTTLGEKSFKFGGGRVMKSKRCMEIPAVMAGKKMTIRTDVVDSEIPLLLSKPAMKKAKVKLDLENDTAEILGKEVALNHTSSGHYCVPITQSEVTPVESVNAVELEGMNDEERKKTLVKLHRQFAHPPEHKLAALLKNAGVWRETYSSILTDIQEKCKICLLYRKTPPRPVVTLPMANRFNQIVTMDLKKWDAEHILHLIDMWSRLTVSMFIPKKVPSVISDKILRHWVASGYGIMEALMTDNGGEFSSEESREVASILNVKLLTTAANSPFQNGMCERNHGVTDHMLLKMIEDYPRIPKEDLLVWVNVAKNSLQMWCGFSSYQLVFGSNPTLPNVMIDKLPALEGKTSSEVLARHLNALHAAREAFIRSEADERIRRALRSKVRASEESYNHGDSVFYKRDGKDRWLGPAKVVFQDGKVIFVRHGSTFVRISPNRLIKANMEFANETDQPRHGLTENQTVDTTAESSGDEGCVINQVTNNDHNSVDVMRDPDGSSSVVNTVAGPTDLPRTKVCAGDVIEYKVEPYENWRQVTVAGRGGKATGKYSDWYNVKETNGEEICVDLGSVEWRKMDKETVEEANIVLIPRRKHGQSDCIEAKKVELQKLKSFDAFQEVDDIGQIRISSTWVLWMKGDTVRARLVARGFEEEQYIRSDSPTVDKSSVRVILALSAAMKWEVKTTDIKSAFLQGKKLDRDVYLIPPEEASTSPGKLWKLKRCLYGLNDAARMFYSSVKEELLALGCEKSSLDPALFYMKKEGHLVGVIGCHIDDFLHAGEKQFEVEIMEKLRSRFLAGKVEASMFRYVGFEVIQTETEIILDQNEYINSLPVIKMDTQRNAQKSDPLTRKESTLLRSIAGKLNWLVQGTRPDIAFELIDVSTQFKKGVVSDLTRAAKVLRRIQDSEGKLCFPALCNVKEWKLVVFSDAAHANLNDGLGSVGGHIVLLMGSDKKCCPLSWKANKVKRVVRSTIAAESLSLLEGLENAMFLQELIRDLCEIQILPIIAFVDNRSVVDAVYTTSMVDDKRLRIDLGAIKEMLAKKQVNSIRWCSGDKQLANCLTKRGASPRMLLHVIQTGVLDIPGLDINV